LDILRKFKSHRALKTKVDHDHFVVEPCFQTKIAKWELPVVTDVFATQIDDELLGASIEDERFMETIHNGISVNKHGNLQMPLPFKMDNVNLPNNKDSVFRRTESTLGRLKAEPLKLAECITSMEKNIAAGHVEEVPQDKLATRKSKAWWLPVFPVVHPKKKKVRLVFDSSASYHGTSLNHQLLQGPDQNNRIRGVLLRFREGEVGFVADIESMFHAFYVDENHRDFLRFYWYKNNNPNNKLVQYRANVHIFGNKSSPSVAKYGLRYTTQHQ
jgi:hypothetical protein